MRLLSKLLLLLLLAIVLLGLYAPPAACLKPLPGPTAPTALTPSQAQAQAASAGLRRTGTGTGTAGSLFTSTAAHAHSGYDGVDYKFEERANNGQYFQFSVNASHIDTRGTGTSSRTGTVGCYETLPCRFNVPGAFQWCRRSAQAMFLPDGFPESVPPEYLTFQKWNILQDSCSYLRGVLSTRAILEGFGVGRSDITAVQAAVNWILRDGASMLGGLLFSTFSSADFGQNVKSWRLFADLINNVGISLDMLAPLVPRRYFLAVVCLASVCKALCGVAAGATGAVLAEHFGGRSGNIASVLAKNGAQHTVVSLLGLAVSVPFAAFANRSGRRMAALYLILTAVHIVSNIAAMRALALRTINISRFFTLADAIFPKHSVLVPPSNSPNGHNGDDPIVIAGVIEASIVTELSSGSLALSSVAEREPLFSPLLPSSLNPVRARSSLLWRSLREALHRSRLPMSTLRQSLAAYRHEPYCLILKSPPIGHGDHGTSRNSSSNVESNEVSLCIREDCQIPAKAVYEWCLANWMLQHCSFVPVGYGRTTEEIGLQDELAVRNFHDTVRIVADRTFPKFWGALEACDWDTQRLKLNLKPKDGHMYRFSSVKW